MQNARELAEPTSAEVAAVPESLRRSNLIVGLIHLVQAIAIIAISNDFKLPIVGRYMTGPPGTPDGVSKEIWQVPVGYGIGLFLLLAAADHLLMAAPGVWQWYRRNLADRINYARWAEYSVSASIMMVLIAMITGVQDFGAVLAIFAVNAAMIFFGLDMEMLNHRRQNVNWWPFIAGSIVGIVPWIIVAVQVAGSSENSTDGVPGFVYGIIITLFILFNSFAINMVLQYAKVGKWKDYVYGEKVYIVLSLIAKSLLAWQVFANTLV